MEMRVESEETLEGVMFWVVTSYDREGMVLIPNGVKSGPQGFRVSLLWGWSGLRWL